MGALPWGFGELDRRTIYFQRAEEPLINILKGSWANKIFRSLGEQEADPEENIFK